VVEGRALLALLSLNAPSRRRNPLISVVYLIWSSFFQNKLHEWFPGQVGPGVQTLLTQSLVPYSEIAKANTFWLGREWDENK
jgi:TM2 domain-containing membrane protein YozV